MPARGGPRPELLNPTGLAGGVPTTTSILYTYM